MTKRDKRDSNSDKSILNSQFLIINKRKNNMANEMIIFILACIGIPFLGALFIHYATKYTIKRLNNLK